MTNTSQNDLQPHKGGVFADTRIKQHSNAKTAPTIDRSSMVPVAWCGFWKGLAISLKLLLLRGVSPFAQSVQDQKEPWQKVATRRRLFFILFSLSITTFATWLFMQIQPVYNNPWLQYGQVILFSVLSFWIVVGFSTALMGFWVMLRGDPFALSARSVKNNALARDVRTAIIMPICNEDTTTVYAGLHAIAESVAATGHAHAFDIYVLSDSYDPQIIEQEKLAWEQLRCSLAEKKQPIEVYYRLRTRRVHKKAGNVADFCRRWGKNYKYMIVLDADSIMSGECLLTLAKLMEANPKAGIIQTSTQAVGQVTLHARVQQFASRTVGRIFTLGTQFWQLGESHYFGHNAIIRAAPFIKHCALAPIKGRGGLAGDIMSHDFIEAALMRRAGYFVWMVADLAGSYEQQPPDLISELQRDRRWCQGNIQNSRLVTEPGIHAVHRAMLATGFMSYFSAPLWMAFLVLGTYLWISDPVAYHHMAFYDNIVKLWVWTIVVLFLPRILGVTAILLNKEQRQYGGTFSLIKSALLETVIAMLQAPIRMAAHSLFVIAALTGLKLEWKSPPRAATAVSWSVATTHFAFLVMIVAGIVLLVCQLDADAIIWLTPVVVPLLLVIPITVFTSQTQLGAAIRKQRLLLIPEETFLPLVIRRAYKHVRYALQHPLATATPAVSMAATI